MPQPLGDSLTHGAPCSPVPQPSLCQRRFFLNKAVTSKIIRDRNNQNILAVAYLLVSPHPYGVLTLDYDLHRADTTTPQVDLLEVWRMRQTV